MGLSLNSARGNIGIRQSLLPEDGKGQLCLRQLLQATVHATEHRTKEAFTSPLAIARTSVYR